MNMNDHTIDICDRIVFMFDRVGRCCYQALSHKLSPQNWLWRIRRQRASCSKSRRLRRNVTASDQTVACWNLVLRPL